jgi:sporulation protein YlmC with PRC-barrel domain
VPGRPEHITKRTVGQQASLTATCRLFLKTHLPQEDFSMTKWRFLALTAIASGTLSFAPALAQDAGSGGEDTKASKNATTQSSGDQNTQDAGGESADGAGQGQSSVDVIALPEWHYDELYAGGTSVENLIDAEVTGPTGEEIGYVENVLFGAEGQVLSIVAEIGGFIDIGDTHVNVPWNEVQVGDEGDEVSIPVTQETIEDYTIFADPVVRTFEASTVIEEVEGDNLGMVQTGLRVWRATELIGDYARLRDGEGFANYGYVDDLIVTDGTLAAVVVAPDPAWGYPGYYAYPYYGYGYGWYPGYPYYDLPYEQADVEGLEPFEYQNFED